MIIRQRRFSWLICAVLLASIALPTFARNAPPVDLDSYVARAMKTYEVPGMAIAIVKDGKVVLQKGYGMRKLGESTAVDAHTVFAIGSNTKAFTAAALATLVDAGKLTWDDPVAERLKGFQMYDPYVSRELRIRDLLCHRSGLGLGEGDLMVFLQTKLTRDDIVDRIRYLKPVTSFRSQYAYSNLMFVTAGQVIAAVSGKSWDDYLHERIFTPLGMNDTNTSVDAYRPGANWAFPHNRAGGKLQVIPFLNVDIDGAAGSINSSVTDMARWVLVQLNHGRIPDTDTPLFSEKSSAEMWTQQTVVPLDAGRTEDVDALRPHFAGYGLGWGLRDYKGRTLIGHRGGVAGYVTRVMLVPEENLGVVILTNSEELNSFEAILYHILDSYLEGPTRDYIALFKAGDDKKRKDAEETMQKAREIRAASSKPSLSPGSYAGDYSDPWYGRVSIRADGDGLVLNFLASDNGTADLQHWQYDTFKTHWRHEGMEDAFVTFALKPDGSIDHFTMAAVSPLADFSFDYQDLYFTPLRAAQKH